MQREYSWLIRVAKKSELIDIINGNIRFSLPKYWIKPGDGINDQLEGVHHISKKIVYRREKIGEIPALCFYGIENKNLISYQIPKKYFEDFAANQEEYGLVIVEARFFYDEIVKALRKIGYDKKDLFFKGIEYVNIGEGYYCDREYPYELCYKDKEKYAYQNETRFIIISGANSKLIDNNYYINIDIKNIQHRLFIVPNEKEKVLITKIGKEFFMEIK